MDGQKGGSKPNETIRATERKPSLFEVQCSRCAILSASSPPSLHARMDGWMGVWIDFLPKSPGVFLL